MQISQFVNTVYSSNTYVITNDNKHFWLVDCGDIEIIIDNFIRDGVVEGVFFTHTHYDHIYGINRLLKFFPRVNIYTNAFGKEALMSPKLNYSKYHTEAEPIICSSPNNIIELRDNDKVFCFPDNPFIVFETPGHDKSCLCYQLANVFFSGDSYIPGVKVFANFLNGNKIDAKNSVERICKISQGLALYPGHGKIYLNNI